MSFFISFLTVVFFIVCVFLVIVILLQSGRSQGGLLGGSSQTALGSSATDSITKFTGVLIAIFMGIAFFLNWWHSYKAVSEEGLLEDLNPSSANHSSVEQQEGFLEAPKKEDTQDIK